MANSEAPNLSFVVPIYNEAAGLSRFHASLLKTIADNSIHSYEIIYCDDGSVDDTATIVGKWHTEHSRVKLLSFSRNFGKENALSAGIAEARGEAVIMLDGDGQHPVELIPDFIEKWKQGAQVIIGVRTNNGHGSWFKRFGSWLFYKIFNMFTAQKLLPGSTDFRLIDSGVRAAFLELNETDRITRGLIDWLGFKREYIHFSAQARFAGSASYSRRQLIKLASNSFVSLTPVPLYIFSFFGIVITALSFILGTVVFIEQLILEDPLSWNFTGTAMLGILIIFLVGILLMSQGILSLYISRIHNQSKGRPLYVIDYKRSAGIKK